MARKLSRAWRAAPTASSTSAAAALAAASSRAATAAALAFIFHVRHLESLPEVIVRDPSLMDTCAFATSETAARLIRSGSIHGGIEQLEIYA
jgi:hypothetical protein